MTDKQSKRPIECESTIDRAQDAISQFRRDDISAKGVLMRPHFQLAMPKAPATLHHLKGD
jgi:hypothetical protein